MTARNNPQPITVEAMPDYRLLLHFENDESKIFDVMPYIKGTWYSELSDPVYFKTVRISGGTVEWLHGQDLCPDELYEDSIPA